MTRTQFAAVRRNYRSTKRLNPVSDPLAVRVRLLAVSAMREATGQWEVCDPLSRSDFYWQWALFPHKGKHIARPIVTRTAQKFFARVGGAA